MNHPVLILDVIVRIEALEIECDGVGEDECLELVRLRSFMADVAGKGSDQKWRGNYYPKAF